jgi:putative protease
MAEKEVGTVNEFFARPMVAGIKLSGDIKLGDRLHLKGHTTDYMFTVASMQVENRDIEEAKNGQEVGVRVPDRVRRGDKVFSEKPDEHFTD